MNSSVDSMIPGTVEVESNKIKTQNEKLQTKEQRQQIRNYLKSFFKDNRDELLKLLRKRDFTNFLTLANRGYFSIYNAFYIYFCAYDRVKIYFNDVTLDLNIHYYNASYVIVNQDNYIACQAPQIYQEQPTKFINLLKAAKIKNIICLLEHEPLYLQDLAKTNETLITSENSDANLKIFEINIGTEVEEHIVKVHHFLNWLDGCALSNKQIEFLYENLKCITKEETKIIHCLAGVGRTGTFILFRALKDLKEIVTPEMFLDTFIEMRKQRPLLVQTEEQLKFLYEYFFGIDY